MASSLPNKLTSDLHNLLFLNLCTNKLASLSIERTRPLQSLKKLELGDNKISIIGLSPVTINLVDLDLSGNQPTVLDSKSHTQLNSLSPAGNQLSEISPNLPQQIPNITVLILSKNKLDSLPKAPQSLACLQTLNIRENRARDADSFTAVHSSLISYLDGSFSSTSWSSLGPTASRRPKKH